MEDSPQTPQTTTRSPEADVKFLLAEYDRLKTLRNTTEEIHYTRFNSYMTVTLAIVGGYLTIATATKSNIPATSPVPEILLGILFIWGVMTFLDMTDLTQSINHFVRAKNEIQRYFTDRSAELSSYLYFAQPERNPPTGKLRGFVARWLGGSPKMVLAVLNAAMGALLIARLLLSLGFLPFWATVLSIIAFLGIGAVHVTYVKVIYRRKYIP